MVSSAVKMAQVASIARQHTHDCMAVSHDACPDLNRHLALWPADQQHDAAQELLHASVHDGA